MPPRGLLLYVLIGVALIFLPLALTFQLAGMWPFAVFYGLDWVASVPLTAALCTACFVTRNSFIVFALCLVFHEIDAATIAAIAGVL